MRGSVYIAFYYIVNIVAFIIWEVSLVKNTFPLNCDWIRFVEPMIWHRRSTTPRMFHIWWRYLIHVIGSVVLNHVLSHPHDLILVLMKVLLLSLRIRSSIHVDCYVVLDYSTWSMSNGFCTVAIHPNWGFDLLTLETRIGILLLYWLFVDLVEGVVRYGIRESCDPFLATIDTEELLVNALSVHPLSLTAAYRGSSHEASLHTFITSLSLGIISDTKRGT